MEIGKSIKKILSAKSSVKGFLDRIDGTHVVGWAWNPDKPEERLTVVIYADGKPVAEGVADQFREDLLKAGIGDGRYGFVIKLPEELADGKEHEVSALIKQNGMELSGGPLSIIINNLSKLTIKGNLDTITNDLIALGWAWNSDDPDERLEVQIVDEEGNILGEGKAELYREDLLKAGIGDGKYGFKIEIDPPSNEYFGKEVLVKAIVKKGKLPLGEPILVKFKNISRYKTFNFNVAKSFISKNLNELLNLNRKRGFLVEIQNQDDFLDTILNKKIPLYMFNPVHLNSAFYKTLAHEKLIGRDLTTAKLLLDLSLYFYKIPHSIELKGNIAKELGEIYSSRLLYESCVNDEVTFWTYMNLAEIYINTSDLKNIQEAINILLKGYEKFPIYSIYIRQKLEEVLSLYWEKTTKMLEELVLESSKEELSRKVWEAVDIIYNSFKKIFCISEPKQVELKKADRLLIIAGSLDLPQCKRYRIDQKLKQLELVNIKADIIPYYEIRDPFEYIKNYDIFLFYRLPPTVEIIKLLALINSLGKISIYEIDDLIFDLEHYPPPIENFGGYVDLSLYKGLIFGSILFNVIPRFCKYGLASTTPLSEKLKELVISKTCFVHRNALDRNHLIIKKSLKDFKDKKELIIFYGSGTLSHNQDFCDLALPALEKILSEYSHVKLWIVGYLKLPQEFIEKFREQVFLIDFTQNFKEYHALLSSADINLAVLYDGLFEGCKSELKWLEAACVYVPSVVSSTANYREIIRHGVDGFIAKNPEDFYIYIKKLIEDDELRYTIAKNAHERVLSEYSLSKLGENFLNMIKNIEQMEKKEVNSRNKNKKRKIALVNVWFPPEEVGGGTVVAVDNLLDIQKLYPDDYEFVVFTSNLHLTNQKPYTFEIYEFNNVKIYKVNTDFNKNNLEWQYYDEKMKEVFSYFLEEEKPDLVHFYAIQRLTASVVEATYEKGIPYIICIHDAWWISDWMFLTDEEGNVYPEGFPDIFKPRPLPKGISLLQSISRRNYLKSCLERASFVYTVSPEFAEIYKKNGITWIKSVPNGISSRIQWVKKDTSYTDKVVLGFSSAFATHKGYYIFEQALRKTKPKNIEVLLIDYSKLENYSELGLIENVPTVIRGMINRYEIPQKFFSKIDVLMHPSICPESYGLTPREAMMCGCWVVVSKNIGCASDFIGREGCFIIEPTVEKLMELIKLIDENPDTFKRVVHHEGLRSSEDQAKEIVKIYEEVLFK